PGLQFLERSTCPPLQLVVELTPSPGVLGVARHFAGAMNSIATADACGPGGSSAFELRKKAVAHSEIILAASHIHKAGISLGVSSGVQAYDRICEFCNHSRRVEV